MKILFYLSKKYSIPIVNPLIDYLLKTNNDFALYLSEKVRNALPEEWKIFTILNSVSEAKKFNPDFVIVPGNFVDPRIPGIKVEIFHGLGIEKKSHYKIRHFFDVYCTSGPFVTKKFNALQKKYKYFSVIETGWPKIDYILNFPRNDLKTKFNIPKDKKIILYAPTHSRKMQSAEVLLPIIPKIIRDNEFWLIKFHELMKKEIVDDFTKRSKKNVLPINSYDITPFLHLADVLVSDTSSVIYEFMILDKPVVTFRTQDRIDKGINIKEPQELRTALDRSLANPMEFHENRMKHLSEINPYRDGKTAKRIFETLINLELPKKKKPINLFRKMQILYHEKFKKGYLR